MAGLPAMRKQRLIAQGDHMPFTCGRPVCASYELRGFCQWLRAMWLRNISVAAPLFQLPPHFTLIGGLLGAAGIFRLNLALFTNAGQT